MKILAKIFRHQCACSVEKSCLTLCNSIGYNPPRTSVHGISQARILGWVAISFSRVSSQPTDLICISCIGFFTTEPPGKPHWHQYHYTLLSESNFLHASSFIGALLTIVKLKKEKKPPKQFKFKIQGNKLEKKHKQYVNLDKVDKTVRPKKYILGFQHLPSIVN